MAFSDLATSGSGGAKIATQNSIVLTTSAATSAGSLAVLVVACDNFQTTDGDEVAVTSVTDSNGTNVWNKAVEMCNGQGTAQTGATVSIWYSTLRGTIASGGTITANLSNGTSRGATAILAWEFGMAAGSSATVGATNTNVGDGAAMTTSLNATTQNREALRFRAWGGEEELTTAITPTSGWSNVGTAANSGTGGVNTSNIIIRGEYHISTGTGDASAPTGGVTCDWASGYVAFYEVLRVLPGWEPTLPVIPAYRRYKLPETAIARGADPAPAAPYIDWDWGQISALTKPAAAVIGTRIAATIGPGNIPAVFSQWVNAGWPIQPPQPPREPAPRLFGAQLPAAINIEAVYSQWVNDGWKVQPPQPPRQPAAKQAGAQLPAAINIVAPYIQWVNAGWEPNQPSSLPRDPAVRSMGAQLQASANVEITYQNWVNTGWVPTLPNPLIHPPAIRLFGGQLPSPLNIPSSYVQWFNVGWQPPSPQPPASRRYQALPEFAWNTAPAAAPAVTTVGWGFDPFPTQPKYRQRYIGPVRLPAAGPAPPTLEWGFAPNNPQPPVPATMQRAGGVLNAWRNNEAVYVFVQAAAVTFGWDPPAFAAPARTTTGQRIAATVGPVNIPSPYVQWVNLGWEPDQPVALPRDPAIRLMAGALPAAANVPAQFQSWRNLGWEAIVPHPLAHPPAARQAAGQLPGPLNIDYVFQDWRNAGWQPQPPQPPRPRFERAGSLPGAINVDARFESWVNSGWTPVLPTLPAFRRLFAMPELSWRADQITPVPHEWGFAPTVPEGLWTWFNRSGAVMPGANIDAPLFDFLSSGWQQIGGWTPPAFRRYPAPNTAVVRGFSPGDLFVVPYEWGFEPVLHGLPRRRWERSAASLPAQLNLPDPFIFVPAAPSQLWFQQTAAHVVKPRLFVGGIASKSQFASFDFFPLYGWEVQSPQPPMPRWRRVAGMAVGDNIEGPLLRVQPYGWDPPDARPLVRRPMIRQGAAQLPSTTNIEIVYQPWANRGWHVEPTLLRAPTRRPERAAAGLPSGDNIEGPFERFLAYGWPAELPRLPHPRPEKAGSIQRGDDGTEAQFEAFRPYAWDAQPVQPQHRLIERACAIQTKDDGIEASFQAWVNSGWEVQPPQPPRRRWENSAAAGRFAADIPPRFENWVNLGWFPTLPTLPAFRRLFAMPELAWRSDPIFSFFVVPYEWGFQPTTPEGLRDWYNRASAVMPGANVEAPLFGFLPGGWASQYTDILAKPPRRFPVSAETMAPAQAIRWVNAGWEATLPLLTGDPAVRLRGAQLQAAVNIDPQFEAFLAHGWQVLPPHLRHPRPEAAGSVLIGDAGIENQFSFFMPGGWQALPFQPPHGKWDKAAAIMRGDDGIHARFEAWVNSGWAPSLPTLPAFRRRFAMPEYSGRYDQDAAAVVLVPYEWGFQPITPDAIRTWAIRAAAIMPVANIEAAYQQWRNLGWGAQPFQPPRRPWEKNAGAIMRGANIEAKYEQWRNQGWVPTLPMLRIVRRAIDLSDFTWRTDTFGPVAHEWGFVPTLPAALRNWYLRAAAIEAINRPYDEFVFVEGVTSEFLQTYFIANMQRMMNRRG